MFLSGFLSPVFPGFLKPGFSNGLVSQSSFSKSGVDLKTLENRTKKLTKSQFLSLVS